jgi:hypothetical protein
MELASKRYVCRADGLFRIFAIDARGFGENHVFQNHAWVFPVIAEPVSTKSLICLRRSSLAYQFCSDCYKGQLQPVGITAMLIACKYEEIWPPQVNDFFGILSKE